MNTYLRMLALCGVGLLTACGGGGGGGGPVGDAGNPALALITPDNAQEIAEDVVSGVMATRGLNEFGGTGLVGSGGPGPALSKAAVWTNRTWTKGVTHMLAAPFGPDVSQCNVDGTLTVSGDLQAADTLTRGDRLALSFAGCDDGDGQVVDGDLTITIDTFSGDFLSGFFALGMTIDFDVFRVTESGETAIVNGDVSMLLDTEAYPVASFAMSSASMSFTEGSETVLLLDYSIDLMVDETAQPAAYTFDTAGTVDVPQHGSVTYRVLTPFTGYGDENPDAGVLYIEGDAGASITVTALSSQQAQLEIDYNGDGIVDEILIVTWVELDA